MGSSGHRLQLWVGASDTPAAAGRDDGHNECWQGLDEVDCDVADDGVLSAVSISPLDITVERSEWLRLFLIEAPTHGEDVDKGSRMFEIVSSDNDSGSDFGAIIEPS